MTPQPHGFPEVQGEGAMGSRLLMAGKAGLGQGVWSQAHKMPTLQSQGGLRHGAGQTVHQRLQEKKKKDHGWERSGRGRQERKGWQTTVAPRWPRGCQNQARVKASEGRICVV